MPAARGCSLDPAFEQLLSLPPAFESSICHAVTTGTDPCGADYLHVRRPRRGAGLTRYAGRHESRVACMLNDLSTASLYL